MLKDGAGKAIGIGRLRQGVLGLAETFAESLALLALVLGSSLATTAVAGEAGAAAPLAYLLAGVGSLCLGSVIIRFTRRMASAGGLYTYISRGLSRSIGFLGGWLYSMGFAAGISFVMVISAVFLSKVLEAHAGIHLGWFPIFLILMAALAVIGLGDIRISTRAQLVVSTLAALIVLALIVLILAKGGAAGVTGAPFDPSRVPSVHDYFFALVFAFTGYIGFEAAAALGEEAAQPLRVIPRAILSAVLVAIVFYVLLTWAMSIGFGVAHASAWASDPTALDTLASRYGGQTLAILVDLAVFVDSFVAGLAGLHLASRVSFAMGREGGLPRAFAWTHPRFRTPWVGLIAALALTLGLVIWLARLDYGPFTYFAFMATTASLPILLTYIFVALAGIVYFWRERHSGATRYNPLLDLLVPIAAIAICALTIYYSIHPAPPHPIDLAPYIAGAWLALGVLIVVVLNVRAPEKVRTFGSVLAGGADREQQRRA